MRRFLSSVNFKKGIVTFVTAYLALVAALFFIQRDLLYYPFGTYQPPQEIGLDGTQELWLPTPDGQEALAWFSPPPEDSSGRVVAFFHGNGGGLKHTAFLLTMLQQSGLGFLAVEYRGYPGYEGKTTEQNIYNDARAAMDFLVERGYTPDKRILLGQSLGSGVAVQMATEYDVGLVALIAPYTAIADAAAGIYWYIPVQWLVLDRFDSFSKIRDITAPLYIFHGTEDTLVPYALGQRLYDHATSQKRFFALDGQGHNSLEYAEIIREIAAFTGAERVTEIPEQQEQD